MNNGAEAVTIPMTKKDEHGNVMDYRITPLAFDDERFKTIRGHLGHDMRTKFMKLYKKTKDAGARTPAVEMSAFLAAFVFEQLVGWYGVLSEITDDPKMAAMNTFHIFGETFKHLSGELAEMAHAEREIGAESAEGNQEIDDGAGDAEGGPDGSDADDGAVGENRGEDKRRETDDTGKGDDPDCEDAEAGEVPLPPGGDPLGSDTETGNDA